MCSCRFGSLLGALSLLLLCCSTSVLSAALQARQACNPQIVVTKVVYVIPILINTYVAQNTSFAVNSDLTITVNNAPTSFDAVTTYEYTTYITQDNTLPNTAYASILSAVSIL